MSKIGEDREFANKLLDDWLVRRFQIMNRPHMRKQFAPVSPKQDLGFLDGLANNSHQ